MARKVGTTTTQYAFDPQGNVAQRLDASGSVLSSSVYDAYGQENSTATPTDPFGYDARWGYVQDRETGLCYCRHRYYDPASGRWLTRDPVGSLGGINLYGYCDGEPLQTIDPEGEQGLMLGPNTETPPSWFPSRPPVGSPPGFRPGPLSSGMDAAFAGAAGVAAAYTCAAIGIGAAIGYGAGMGLNSATGGGWGQWWGEELGLIAPENNSDVSRVTWYDNGNQVWGRPFYLHTGDDDCEWEKDLNDRTCRKMRNIYKRRACWERSQEIYSECLASK